MTNFKKGDTVWVHSEESGWRKGHIIKLGIFTSAVKLGHHQQGRILYRHTVDLYPRDPRREGRDRP
ncbi:MAG: hypothetical protein J3T61_09595 [Candidatus Brocadiales bacterium]|nr:hypothetical protein [Candidatus Bathyanammoxibius sp.]